MKRKYNAIVSRFIKEKFYCNTYMSFMDNTHIEIENCKRILDYSDVYIRVKTSTLIVSIYGENLNISDYNTDGIIVDGKFSSVEFE